MCVITLDEAKELVLATCLQMVKSGLVLGTSGNVSQLSLIHIYKNEIKEEEYAEFYQYIANAYDQPLYRLHFSVDAPLSINALLYVPGENLESIGFGKLEPGVNLYCRKVLIQQHLSLIHI